MFSGVILGYFLLTLSYLATGSLVLIVVEMIEDRQWYQEGPTYLQSMLIVLLWPVLAVLLITVVAVGLVLNFVDWVKGNEQ